jgi:hypothetical protein
MLQETNRRDVITNLFVWISGITKGVRDVFRSLVNGDRIQAQNVSDSSSICVAFHRSSNAKKIVTSRLFPVVATRARSAQSHEPNSRS